jgi:hypothetical protein
LPNWTKWCLFHFSTNFHDVSLNPPAPTHACLLQSPEVETTVLSPSQKSSGRHLPGRRWGGMA